MSDAVKKAIGRYLCGDVALGKECEHHEEIAAEIAELVDRFQKNEREKIAKEALERLAASGNSP